MAKPKIKSAFESAMGQLLDPKVIYASAFEHAARQIEAALESGEKLSEMIRARALELVEFADLVDTTLAARSEALDEEPQENQGEEKGKGEPKEEQVQVTAEPAAQPTPGPKE